MSASNGPVAQNELRARVYRWASCTANVRPGSTRRSPQRRMIEQYWHYALFAAVAIVRECAARTDMPVEVFIAALATHSGIEVS